MGTCTTSSHTTPDEAKAPHTITPASAAICSRAARPMVRSPHAYTILDVNNEEVTYPRENGTAATLVAHVGRPKPSCVSVE